MQPEPCTRIYIILMVCSLFIGNTFPVRGQGNIPVGSWRVHLTYYDVQALALGEEKVYAASGNGFFFFDQTDNLLTTLSTIDGLSGTNVASLAYSESTARLVIAYQNGNVDLFSANEIINIRSILNSNFQDKTIYQAKIAGAFAYLATAFGVVKVDLANGRVQETYANIGFNGAETDIYAITLTADSIFLGSEQGLMVASLAENVNRLDFNNWRTITPANLGQVRQVGSLGNDIFFTVDNVGAFRYRDDNWEAIPTIPVGVYAGLSEEENALYLSVAGQLWAISEGGSATQVQSDALRRPAVAYPDPSGGLWVADQLAGLLRIQNGQAESFTPSGTFSSDAFRLHYFQNKIVAVSGGYTGANYQPRGNQSGFYVFEDGQWANYNALGNVPDVVDIAEAQDLTDAAFNLANGEVYFSSFGDGIFRWNPTTNAFEQDENAPTLPATQGGIRVAALHVDFPGNLWAAYFDVPSGSPAFAKRTPEGEWSTVEVPTNVSRFALDLEADFSGNIWARVAPERGGGLLVFNENGDFGLLTSDPDRGDLPSNAVYAVALDREGSLWIGTDDGVAEIFNPGAVFSGEGVSAITPRFEGRSLLADEKVTAIAVDGGNRKWIGTETGLWLFSEDGTELIAFFDEENSPLISNNILDIAVHPATGEVFIATDRGLISYRGTATEAVYEHQEVKVFPNPVTPDFGGVVSISGLSQDATVKITDVRGRLIWQTQAAGGTATWNMANYNGVRAKTGIYLVFSASRDGQENFVARIAVIE